MRIYNYDRETGEFTGESLADESPLEPGVWLFPAHSTDTPPPIPGASQRSFFIGGEWIQKELEDEIEPVETQESPPAMATRVSPRQIRLTLLAAGITPAMIEANLAGNPAALIEWEYALEIARDNPLIAAMGAALGFAPEQIDSLFAAAAAID